MEEELSENELEERMYAMLHYVDDTQANVNTNQKDLSIVDSVPQSTVRRYWRTNDNQNTTFQKINTSNQPATTQKDVTEKNQTKAKDEKSNQPTESADLSIFQQPVPENIKKTIEILDNEDVNRVVELESSDEDEVIEVALPPKPTITIESSDEEETCTVTLESPSKTKVQNKLAPDGKTNVDREVTASPVPSVVSSVSDEFIRGDCIALNISSKHNNNQSFDFSLHGSDLLDQTPSKKKKKKRNKEATSTPISTPTCNTSTVNSIEECFATPKSKAKNKRQRTKSYKVSEKSVPNADVYDSDSNQSIAECNKNPNTYSVKDKSLPNTDVYESDSNQSENVPENPIQAVAVTPSLPMDSSESSSSEFIITDTPKATKKNNSQVANKTIDLTLEDTPTIDENIVMGNVSGLTNVDDYCEENILPSADVSKCGSTKIPSILNEDLDFDNLKGNNRVCKRRQYSLTALRAEMEKFYNESWGGEDFNHREIQKNMSRDKSLWVIDPKDRMPSMSKRKTTCNYCNRVGHRDDTCRMKPPICYMCGSTGHFEPRCPRKICVNCGMPNHLYSTMCSNCSSWNYIRCAECGQNGHPASHCPDVWRRYHNTISLEVPLEENRLMKKHFQLFCSGCTRRGHLVHTCRISLPFSRLPINSPYVAIYRPVYTQIPSQDDNQNTECNDQRNKQLKQKNMQQYPNSPATPKNDRCKRQSKSPVVHESHLNKKRNLGATDISDTIQTTQSLNNTGSQRKVSESKEQPDLSNKETMESNKNAKKASENQNTQVEKTLDYIPIFSDNRDKSGQIIQDNEVSDTSEVITSARVYITKEITERLKKDDGRVWLNDTIRKNNLGLENDDITFYLSIKGSLGNQEAFQAELRDWISNKENKEHPLSENISNASQEALGQQSTLSANIPKNRNVVLRKLSKALESLKKDLGDPQAIYKELVFLQNKHQKLLSQKVISPQKLSNSREHINGIQKKLNMVLLGQAGLAEGSKHISELYLLLEKLTNFRQKVIPTTLREEIGEHFHCIFAGNPRNDYAELVKTYYKNKPSMTFTKKNNDKKFKVSPKPKQKKKVNTVPNFPKNLNVDKDNTMENFDNTPHVEKHKNKLIFLHRRLLYTQPPIDSGLKNKRNNLMQQLHMHISLLQNNKSPIPYKTMKKMKRLREQAHSLLKNI